MPKALQHEFPRWQDDPHAEDSNDEPREVWQGAMRVVSAKRARKLRKRGVPLMPLHAVHTVTYSTPCGGALRVRIEPITPNGRARYAWFECKDNAEGRRRDKARACYNTWCEANGGRVGRRYELARRLADQREDRAAHEYFRKGGKLAATTYFQTFERHGLYAGVIHENVLQGANPQLDLYAEVARQIGLGPQVATGEALDELAKLHGMPAHWTDEQREQYLQHGYVVEVGDTRNMTATEVDELRRQHRSPPVTLWCAPYESTGPLEQGENPLQRATRETMLQAERDGLVQRVQVATRLPAGVLRGADEYAAPNMLRSVDPAYLRETAFQRGVRDSARVICPTCEGDPVASDGSICSTCEGACVV